MINERDIAEAFSEIELELIQSMKRNMKKHLKDEKIEDIDFTQWQGEMLKGLDEYLIENKKRLPSYYKKINKEIENMIKNEYKDGALSQERKILQSILDGQKVNPSKKINKALDGVKGKTLKDKARTLLETEGTFFKINDRAVNDLIDEALTGIKKGESAILRDTSDIYRDVIFKSQLKAQLGNKTIYQAVDEATKDFLSKGITSIRYKDGKMVNIQSYSEMAIRTSKKRAFLTGEGEMRKEWGLSLILTSQYGACSPTCLPYQNKVCIDDVFSGGKPDGVHPLLSDFMANGFYHPNCRHTHSTYFSSITSKRKDLDKTETSEHYELEQIQRYNERQIRKFRRLEAGTLDTATKDKYSLMRHIWEERNTKLIKDNPGILRRDEWRESSQLEKILITPPAAPAPVIPKPKLEPIKERLKNKNIHISGRFEGLSEEVEDHLLNYIDTLTSKYKVEDHLKKYKLELKTRKEKSCAYYKHTPMNFTYNEFVFSKDSFKDIDKLEDSHDRMVKINWWMKCDKDRRKDYIITHEFGHYLEAVMHSKTNLDYDLFNRQMMNKIKDTYKDMYKEELKISHYGRTSPAEFFAESFAESELYKDSKLKKVFEKIFKEEGLL